MSSKDRLRERGLLRSVAEIERDGARTTWEERRVARKARRAANPQIQARAEKHNWRRDQLVTEED